MSKCHEEELLKVYEALARDALCSFPQLEREFQRDLVRLRRFLRVRGVAVFTVDLPAFGKHFDRCLAEDKWIPTNLPLTGRIPAGPAFPKFLRGLLRLVFEEDGQLKNEDLDIEAVLFIRQFLYCAKKTELPCPAENTQQEVAEYVELDANLPRPEMVWEVDDADATMMLSTYRGFKNPSSGYIERFVEFGVNSSDAISLCENLEYVSSAIAGTLGSFDYTRYRFRHGPGAIAERTGPVNKYHWVNWSDRLEGRFPIADCGFHNYSSWARSYDGFNKTVDGLVSGTILGINSHEARSRLCAVPKTVLKPRLIAAEPSENAWCQQNLRHYFDERCRDSWIGKFVDFHDQTLNQRLCKNGSRDGSLLTCDLSSASDRVTCAVVGQVFRSNPELLCALQAVRTRFLRQGINPAIPEEIELRKFSTMGSAVTFPVQSLVFLTITLAVALTKGGLTRSVGSLQKLVGKVAVYGDDIIAPCDCWELLQKALSALHFKVNASKSYATGRFRESCGVDSFRGVDVTPTYWKGICLSNPESIRSTLEVRNNFYSKFFTSTARYIESTIPCTFVTVAMDSGVEGTKSFVRPQYTGYKYRWNCDLQRMEAMSSVLSSRSEKLTPIDESGLLQYFTEAPSPQDMWTAGVAQTPRLRIRRAWVPVDELGFAP